MKILYSARFWPNIFVSKMPFKILEYYRLRNLTRISPTDTILDLGCGGGLQTCLLAKDARKVIGVDVDDLQKANLKKAHLDSRYNIEFIQGRLQDMQFAEGMFDKIFSFCVIEHIPEYVEILEYCYYLLKTDGELLISVDSLEGMTPEIKGMHSQQHKVSHYFTLKELEKLLEELSFRDVQVKPLFCSQLAYNWFIKGIKNDFKYTFFEAIVMWKILSWFDIISCKRKKGIFLLARCKKINNNESNK